MDKEYLNNVINHIVKNITIDSSSTDKFHPKGKIFFPWLPFPLSISREILSFFDSNDPWNARPNFHKYCRDNFGLNGKEMKIVLDKLNFIIKDKVKDLYDLPISRFNKLNESTEGKQKEFFDKILDRIVKDTVITDSKITFPFAIFKQEELTGDSLLSVSIWIDGRWENHKYPSRFNKYCMDNYGLTYEESLILWRRYMEIIEKEVLNRLRKNKSNVATIWGMTRHDINESVDKQKKLLDKVIEHLVKDTKMDYNNNLTSLPPFLSYFPPHSIFPLSLFSSYCKNTFGLTNDEIEYVWKEYIKIIEDKIKNGEYLNENVNKQKEFLDYVYTDLVNNTKFRDNESIEIDVYDGKCKSLQAGISWGSVAPYFNFISQCLEDFLKNTYGLTYDEIQELFWDRYDEHIINMVLTRKERISPYIRGHVDYLREDKETKFLNEQFRKTENLKSSMENLLNQELKILSKDSWVNGEMLEEINSIESIVVDDVIRNVGPYNFMVFVTLNVDINNAPFDLYKSIINYVEMMGNEIIPKFKIKYKVNDTTNRVPSNSPYLRESIEDKETGFLKKVVSRMVDETVPYNKIEGVTSVVTPFVAHKETGSRWVLSPDYCKRIVDDFDDNFTMGKIFIDYLDMYGLSYEEMEEVLYWYFNEIFEKYFKRFYDLSYKTRPRLDEGVDLGFVDKVADRVLKEIVWDYDRGFVYFPMIDYSANIRDDDFLAPLMSDDPFSIHFRERNETSWHDDLMKHVEDIYGITGNEWNRVWGSLQGELWDKHVDYWNTFTGGY